jgi:hypothetical protein
MVIPTIFIVGAPRCGTTSLYVYLKSHPQVFMSNPKEPFHFGLDFYTWCRFYADRREYLRLFQRARDDQHAGEATVLYLYSKTAPHEIKAFSPSARILISLRDPVEMVCSNHALNTWLLNEDLPLEEAINAEEDRAHGRRIPWSCMTPLALQYTALGRYTEHILRYQEVFGRDRVKCVLFDDLKNEPERVYKETLAFLGLEPAGSPNFKQWNERRRWRSQRLARFTVVPYRRLRCLCNKVPAGRARNVARRLLGILSIPFFLMFKVNADKRAVPSRASPEVRKLLRQRFRPDIERLATLLGRDLSSWLEPE